MTDELTEDKAQEWLDSVNAEILKIHAQYHGKMISQNEILANAVFWNKLVEEHCPQMTGFIALMMRHIVLHAINVNEGGMVH